MMSCREFVELIASDMPMTWGQRVGYWLHLLICKACRLYLKQLLLLRNGLRKWSQSKIDRIAEEHLTEDILKKLED